MQLFDEAQDVMCVPTEFKRNVKSGRGARKLGKMHKTLRNHGKTWRDEVKKKQCRDFQVPDLKRATTVLKARTGN